MTRHWTPTAAKAEPMEDLCLDALLVGGSAAMRKAKSTIALAAPSDATVLVQGDTGVGKELAAQALHMLSGRSGRLVAVNCAAIPSELLESELFGHEKGAFTGATEARAGRVEQAHNGTLFLDEIGDMPLELQSKLLRVLEARRVQRLGGQSDLPVDFRLVCATHRNLGKEVEAGRFRADLFFRIAVIPMTLPALRDRTEDLPSLLDALGRSRIGTTRPVFTLAALRVLKSHSWPGNVRELRNVYERALVLFPGREISGQNAEELVQGFDPAKPAPPVPTAETAVGSLKENLVSKGSLDFRRRVQTVEAELIEAALDFTDGCVSHAALALKLQRTTLIEKMKKLGITSDQFRVAAAS